LLDQGISYANNWTAGMTITTLILLIFCLIRRSPDLSSVKGDGQYSE
jgi:hypothetical protein